MDIRELNKITRFTCREGQSKRRRWRSQTLSWECRVQNGESLILICMREQVVKYDQNVGD
jgi:hypothetical protein